MTLVRLMGPVLFFLLPMIASPAVAQHAVQKVLWWNGMIDLPPEVFSRHREAMADYLTAYGNGQVFSVDYKRSTRGGALANQLASNEYNIVILDLANRQVRLNGADTQALQRFYASGKNALMLDGSFSIRNMTHNPNTQFPGKDGALGGILVNQISFLADAGGGIFVGTDHNDWQSNANRALTALLPNASFRGTTNPSTDGDFIGAALLGKRVSVTARTILRHWESVPNQGEAPVGQFRDFMGQTVSLYSLVEAADKPGGGRKRPYISASIFPGNSKTAIDSESSGIENLPTHKGPS